MGGIYMQAIQSTVNEAVVTLTISLIGLLAAYATYGIHKATQKVKTQTAQLKDENARRLLNNALEDVEELTVITVSAIEQTTAKQLREAVKDGKADRNELINLSKQAALEIMSAVKPETRKQYLN
jgi:vacuolar-type H+-ATPase subunit H